MSNQRKQPSLLPSAVSPPIRTKPAILNMPSLITEKQISSTNQFNLPQHIQDHLKHKQQIFKTRQSLMLYTCKQGLHQFESSRKVDFQKKISNKLKKERKYLHKNEKKEVDRHVKSKLSAMLQQLPMMSRGSFSSMTRMKRRDSSLQLLLKQSSSMQQATKQPAESKDFPNLQVSLQARVCYTQLYF